MLTSFIVLQSILLLFMLFHDWVSIRPFNDLETMKKVDSNYFRAMGSTINGGFVLIPLILTLKFYGNPTIPLYINLSVFLFYLGLTIGTILSWWVPYFFGSSPQHKQRFAKFKNTHHFLPQRGDNVIPNTLHVILHLQVWTCCAIAGYYL